MRVSSFFSLPSVIVSERGRIVTIKQTDESPDVIITEDPRYKEPLLSFSAKIPEELPKRHLIVGAREFTPGQTELIKNLNIITPWNISCAGLEISDSIMEFCSQQSEIFISININVVEGIGSLNGLSVRELIYFVQRLSFIQKPKKYQIIGNHPIVLKILAEI